jgi:hypothetical protein
LHFRWENSCAFVCAEEEEEEEEERAVKYGETIPGST